jgi:hypothetical protein
MDLDQWLSGYPLPGYKGSSTPFQIRDSRPLAILAWTAPPYIGQGSIVTARVAFKPVIPAEQPRLSQRGSA